MKRLAVLGSTGSIGSSTLEVVESFPDDFDVRALAAGRNLNLLRQQIKTHRPAVIAVARAEDAEILAAEFPDIECDSSTCGLIRVACCDEADTVVAAMAGSTGLEAIIAAIQAGKNIALANKESLVVAGELMIREAANAGVDLLPVDSEHCAIHQALRVGPQESVSRLILTASGGPFRTWSAEKTAAATIEETLNHPTWKMGKKISVDSATMMNKGFEIFEAHHLFDVAEDRIDVVIHPQSLVHSMVEFVDGSVIAQLAVNDMKIPILHALSYPERLSSPFPNLDLTTSSPLTFEKPDPEKYPALDLARNALREGGELPAVLNAANEVAVDAFIEGRCRFPEIVASAETVVDSWSGRNCPLTDLDQAREADREARKLTAAHMRKYLGAANGSEIRC